MKVTNLDDLRTVGEAWDAQAVFYGLDPEAGSPQRYAFYAGAAALLMLISNASDAAEDPEEMFPRLLDELASFAVDTGVPE